MEEYQKRSSCTKVKLHEYSKKYEIKLYKGFSETEGAVYSGAYTRTV